MSVVQNPLPAKLVIGAFVKDKAALEPVAAALTARFGTMDIISAWMPFDMTEYYRAEMGAPLFRRIWAYKALIDPGVLADIKHETLALEAQLAANGRRRVNIDPGYLVPERFVLATGKNFAHRIYIGRGIYADLTLLYRYHRFETLAWTYPDYSRRDMVVFLERVRRKYMQDLGRRTASPPSTGDRHDA